MKSYNFKNHKSLTSQGLQRLQKYTVSGSDGSSLLESEKISLLQGIVPKPEEPTNYLQSTTISHAQKTLEKLTGEGTPEGKIKVRFEIIKFEISELIEKKNKLEEQIEAFLKEKQTDSM